SLAGRCKEVRRPMACLLRRPFFFACAALVSVATVARPGGTQPAPPPPPAASAKPADVVDTAPIVDAVQKLTADVQRWGGTSSVRAVDLATGRVLVAMDDHRAMNPASNAKLATAAAALRVLGAHHRFLTGLYGRLDSDAIDELVLRSDGDPSLRTA